MKLVIIQMNCLSAHV